MSNELTTLLANKQALVVEAQIPIVLEIQEMLMDHGASEVKIAASLLEARRLLAGGFRPQLAVVDLARFDADAQDLVEFLNGDKVALVLTMATPNGRKAEERARTMVLTKPYFESELKDALAKVLRADEGSAA